ncbi:MAG: hypothetical protein IJL80_02555 [Treponema sp.]|nr:hypothetical protein [Treponema sp.]
MEEELFFKACKSSLKHNIVRFLSFTRNSVPKELPVPGRLSACRLFQGHENAPCVFIWIPRNEFDY